MHTQSLVDVVTTIVGKANGLHMSRNRDLDTDDFDAAKMQSRPGHGERVNAIFQRLD